MNMKKTHLDHVKYIVKFYEEHNRLPSSHKYLGVRLIINKYRKGGLDQDAIDYINDSLIPTEVFNRRITKTHLDHVKDIVTFYEEHKRTPTQLEFGSSILEIKKTYRMGKLDQDAIDYINNSIMPIEILERYVYQTHLDHVKRIVKFYEEHNRIPTRKEYKQIDDIKKQYRMGKLDQDAIDYINNSIMSIEILEKHQQTHLDHVKRIVKFYEEHNRIPTETENVGIKLIKCKYRKGRLDQDAIDYINDSSMPIEVLDKQVKKTHLDHVKCIVKFYEEHNRLPTHRSNYTFITTIKDLYRKGKLDQDAIDYINNSIMPIEILDVRVGGKSHYIELKRIYNELLELNDISAIMELQKQVNQVYEIKLEELLPV